EKKTLKWAIDNLTDKGDALYIIHVKPSFDVESRNLQWVNSGSLLIPLSEFREPDIMKKYDAKTDVEVLNMCDIASPQKEIIVVAKIYWGDPREKVLEVSSQLKNILGTSLKLSSQLKNV
ncbi:U-box domain-containing protein 34, partial [Bienertia sinuspersici]